MKWKEKQIGLALGGGGARGFAHIGVLKVLHEASTPIDLLVGTSIGALIGAAYVGGTDPFELEKKAFDFLESPEFQSSAIQAIEKAYCVEETGLKQKIQKYIKNRYHIVQALFRPGLLSSEEFRPIIEFFIPDIQIEETRIPYRAVATDLGSGERIVLSTGSLRQAVMASCAVPGAIAPLRENEMILSDGGIICLVPASVAREEGADWVIAVSVTREKYLEDELRTAIDVYYRAIDIMTTRLKNYELSEADVIIEPRVGTLHWSDFSQAKALVTEGEKATREKMVEIRRLRSPFKKWFTLNHRLRSKTV
jgi:NTE family protein